VPLEVQFIHFVDNLIYQCINLTEFGDSCTLQVVHECVITPRHLAYAERFSVGICLLYLTEITTTSKKNWEIPSRIGVGNDASRHLNRGQNYYITTGNKYMAKLNCTGNNNKISTFH